MKARTNRSLSVLLFAILVGLTGCKTSTKVLITPVPFSMVKVPPLLNVFSAPDGLLIKSGASGAFAGIAGGYKDMDQVQFQWERCKNPVAADIGTNLTWKELMILDTNFVTIPGATNSTYHIQSASGDDVAFYRVRVTAGTNSPVVSAAVPLWVWEKTHSIIVQGTVVTGQGNGSGCPGPYNARIDFPYEWAYASSSYRVCDLQQTASWIRWYDYYLTNPGCNHVDTTGCVTFSVPRSAWYAYTIYSPSVVSTPYNIYLQ